ncbi:MAG: FAD-binding oxidoreductase [Reyranella sp.]|nr:FAD-binding oxidoreductase [Reyranella sp.]
MAVRPNVVVVGAGIVGASIAWHLIRSGARVTVVEANNPGGIATRNSWAWINASWGNPEAYFRLRVCAMNEWRRLERDLPNLRVAWTGSLNWELPTAKLEVFAAQHAAWGYDVRRVDRAEAQRIEPNLADPPDLAVHAPCEGAIEPLMVARQLLSAARELGATIIDNRTVQSLDVCAGSVAGVETDSGRLDADQVVVAAGAGTAALAATAGLALPVSVLPALLIVTKPHGRLLNGLVMTPVMQLRQTADGRFVAAAIFSDADFGDDGATAAARLFSAIESLFSPMPSLAFDFHVVGRRPIPLDGFPLVGRAAGIDGLHVAVTHSGVTLAPAIGRFVAEEIVTGRRDPLLAPFGLERLPK